MTVLVEVVLLRLTGQVIGYRWKRAPLPSGSTPDAVAAALAGSGSSVQVLHSTSWRWADDQLVVTYAAVPDPDEDLPAQSLDEPSVVCSGDPLRPTPDQLHGHHVAAHAVRHLAYLAERDPAVAAAAGEPDQRGLWAAMTASAAEMPTAPHETAHETARETAHRSRDDSHVGTADAFPHAAVVGVRYGRGVFSVAWVVLEADGRLALHVGSRRWTFLDIASLTSRGPAGRLTAAGLRLVVLGESDPGRYAPPGTIIVDSVPKRWIRFLLQGASSPLQLRRERRQARDRLLDLLRATDRAR